MKEFTTFEALLKPLTKELVEASVKRFDSDYYSKTFKTYDHLLVLLYAQLHNLNSLRDLEIWSLDKPRSNTSPSPWPPEPGKVHYLTRCPLSCDHFCCCCYIFPLFNDWMTYSFKMKNAGSTEWQSVQEQKQQQYLINRGELEY